MKHITVELEARIWDMIRGWREDRQRDRGNHAGSGVELHSKTQVALHILRMAGCSTEEGRGETVTNTLDTAAEMQQRAWRDVFEMCEELGMMDIVVYDGKGPFSGKWLVMKFIQTLYEKAGYHPPVQGWARRDRSMATINGGEIIPPDDANTE